ncbi:hypothetical protein [Domibacillus indicus]|uniref:hypothetical protein n=1 Tax=Domibacillus indicus TaxID=1437523 RepID=UPI0012E0BBEB|nr:hypothetical protein [Domibacillus indicus]
MRIIKKYFVFLISFALLFTAAQIGIGLLLTLSYAPDFSSAGGSLDSQTAFGQTSLNETFAVIMFAAATLAYFLTEKLFKASSISEK